MGVAMTYDGNPKKSEPLLQFFFGKPISGQK